MKNPNYNYDELVNYLDRTTTDPMVRRLIDMILNDEELIMEQLINVGMDSRDKTFEYAGDYYHVEGYINQLKSDVEYYQDEARDWENRCEDAEVKIKSLSARSVTSLLREMEQLVVQSKEETYRVTKEVERVRAQNKELDDKINMWKVLES